MENLIEVLQETAEPLPDVASESFATMFDRYGDAQVVLIGEASHGTREFYQARAAITRHLVKHHCSGLMKPDTHLGENARQIEVSDDQTTPLLYS
ncbi:hypothetical protein [Pseudomonas sp. AP42]|uniref:hypothetical protein n=1 Tax=unclassified Pseudomonas TaxID=196821 RepID=UPI0015A743A0